MQIQPYLFFNGRCEEALAFYREKLGAEVLYQVRFKDAAPEHPVSANPEKIMHASFRIGGSELMASDGDCNESGLEFKGFNLSIAADDVASGEKLFKTLAEGGQVTMPWQKTFWSPGFGMLTDKFGVHWMVNVPQEG
jgi:PhnB protein